MGKEKKFVSSELTTLETEELKKAVAKELEVHAKELNDEEDEKQKEKFNEALNDCT